MNGPDNNQKLILKAKLSEKIASSVFVLFFLSIFFWIMFRDSTSSFGEHLFSLVGFAVFAVLSIFQFLDSFDTIEYDGNFIRSRRLFRQVVVLTLSEISSMRHSFWRHNLRLLDSRGDPRIRVNEGTRLFPQFFDILREKRKDLWRTPTETKFRMKRSVVLELLSPILILLPLMGFLAAVGRLKIDTAVLGTFVVLFFLYYIRKQVVGLEIEPDGLLIVFPVGSKRLPFLKIVQVVLKIPGESGSSHYSLTISAGEKQQYYVRAFQVHEVLLYDKLASLIPGKVVRAASVGKLHDQTR